MFRRTICWLCAINWIVVFAIIFAPTWLSQAAVIRSASVEQKIDMQTQAFQSSAPCIYVGLILLIAVIFITVNPEEKQIKRNKLGRQLSAKSRHEQRVRKLHADVGVSI